MEQKPRHVAVIMDGNGRWATMRRKARSYGHRRGVAAAQGLVRSAAEYGVDELTLFGFSSENRGRPKREIEFLMWLFSDSLGDLSAFVDNGIRLRFVGALDYFGQRLLKRMREVEEETAPGKVMQVNVALNYGGRWDIAQAVARMERKGQTPPDLERVQQAIEQGLSVGDADLVIRTGDETRISNFLLWQSAYAEIYFTGVLWPDFDDGEFKRAMRWFARRRRRFGKTPSQLRTGKPARKPWRGQ